MIFLFVIQTEIVVQIFLDSFIKLLDMIQTEADSIAFSTASLSHNITRLIAYEIERQFR